MLIAIAILLPTLLWSDLSNPFVWVVVFSTTAFGAIGFADDYIKVVKRRNLGLTARAKMFWQTVASLMIACGLVVMQQFRMYSTRLNVPFIKHIHPELTWAWLGSVTHIGVLAFLPFVIFVTLVIVFSSNAVN